MFQIHIMLEKEYFLHQGKKECDIRPPSDGSPLKPMYFGTWWQLNISLMGFV